MASSLRLVFRKFNNSLRLDINNVNAFKFYSNNSPTFAIDHQRKQFTQFHCHRWYSGSSSGHNVQNKQQAMEKVSSTLLSPDQTNEQVIDSYNKSMKGKEYDEYMDILKFIGPKQMADTALSVLPDFKDAKILDVGAGSGLGGVEMQAVGFTNVDAVEPSTELLKVAESKNVYKRTICHLVGSEILPFDDDTYDMVVMSGVMVQGHLPKEALNDLIRIVKPGGHIVNVFREPALTSPWYGEGLEPYFSQLEQQGKWKQIKRSTFPNFVGDVPGITFVHQVQ